MEELNKNAMIVQEHYVSNVLSACVEWYVDWRTGRTTALLVRLLIWKTVYNTNKSMCTRVCVDSTYATTSSRLNKVGMNARKRPGICSESLQQNARTVLRKLKFQSPYLTTCRCSCYGFLRPYIQPHKCLEFTWPTNCTHTHGGYTLLCELRIGRYSCRHL